MAQSVLTVTDLPDEPIHAAAQFHTRWLGEAEGLIAQPGVDAIAIVLPMAPVSHDHWRTAIARDLARLHAPVRVNVIASNAAQTRDALLTFLRDAHGVTGQYHPGHE